MIFKKFIVLINKLITKNNFFPYVIFQEAMKFLIFSNYLPSVLNLRGKLLEAIYSKGYEIHILAPDIERYHEDRLRLVSLGYYVHSVPMQRTGTSPISDLNTLLSTYRALKAIKPDFILSYTIKPVIYGTLAAWLARVPRRFALLPGLGYAFQKNGEAGTSNIVQKTVHKLYQKALAKASKVFFQNPDDLKLFIDLKLLNSIVPPVLVNGSGVDISEFGVLPFTYDQEGNVKSSFLLIARLLKDKGIIEYIKAARKVKEKYPLAEFNLVGWIDENPAAIEQQQLDSWVEEGIINYWGHLDDVRPAIAACSVYVLPSYREGTPRTVLEAMSMGRAVITTDAPGCRETVINNYNGYLVPIKNVDELANTMCQFIENPKLYERMGKASRRMALDKYDVKKINNHMISEMGL